MCPEVLCDHPRSLVACELDGGCPGKSNLISLLVRETFWRGSVFQSFLSEGKGRVCLCVCVYRAEGAKLGNGERN